MDEVVPIDAVRALLEAVVAVVVLLLRPRARRLLEDRIRDIAARRPAVEPVEHGLALDIEAPRGRGLRDGPLEREVRVLVVLLLGDRHVLDADPEVAGRIVVRKRARSLHVRQLHVERRSAEAEDLRVVADVDRLHLRVVARQEEEGVAVGSELLVMLLLEDRLDGGVDFRQVVIRRKDIRACAKQLPSASHSLGSGCR